MTSSHEERKTYDPYGVPHAKQPYDAREAARADERGTDHDEVVTTGTAAGAWVAPVRPAVDDWLSTDRCYAQHDAMAGNRWRGEAPPAGVESGLHAVDKDRDDSADVGGDVDDVLSKNIAQRVLATDYIDVSHVHVAVARANVTLTGSVLTERQLKEIETLVAGCRGVRRIDNRLRVQGVAGGR